MKQTAGAAEEQRRKMRSCGWRALKSRNAAQYAETSTLRHRRKSQPFRSWDGIDFRETAALILPPLCEGIDVPKPDDFGSG
jgi:hypothetical protein